MNCRSWAYVQKSDNFQLFQQDEHWSSEGKISFTRWPPSWLMWGTVVTAGCSSIKCELESQFSSTYIFLYLALLYNANYKNDKLIICKSRKYWDSYCKEKHNLTQCSFKFIIIYIFHTFFIILTLLFLSLLIKLWIKSEIIYCSQTQNYRWWSLWQVFFQKTTCRLFHIYVTSWKL